MTDNVHIDLEREAEKLLSFINDNNHSRERECQSYLNYIKEHLCGETPSKIINFDSEEPNRFGSADFSVSAIISRGRGMESKIAYVWELKAPQRYIFQFDDSGERLRPTEDLIKAETQLFHYVSEFLNSTAYRQKFGLDPISDVKAEGIIMSRRDRLVNVSRRNVSEEDKKRLVDYSMWVRNTFLYGKAGIRLMSWDWVVEKMRAKAEIVQRRG